MRKIKTINEETTGIIHKLNHQKDIECPHCGHEWKHQLATRGKRLVCPQCHESFIM